MTKTDIQEGNRNDLVTFIVLLIKIILLTVTHMYTKATRRQKKTKRQRITKTMKQRSRGTKKQRNENTKNRKTILFSNTTPITNTSPIYNP